MDPYAAAYVSSRDRVAELARTIDESEWRKPSPLTPGWSLRDVLGHLCGAVTDIKAGKLPPADMDSWTAAQVIATRDVPMATLVDEWESSGIEAFITKDLAQMLLDQITHEYDIRYGLSALGEHDNDAVRLAARWASRVVIGARPSFVELDGERREFTGSDPSLADEPIGVTTTSFEFLRAMTGRRSWHQVTQMAWVGPLEEIRHKLYGSGFFTPQPFDVVE